MYTQGTLELAPSLKHDRNALSLEHAACTLTVGMQRQETQGSVQTARVLHQLGRADISHARKEVLGTTHLTSAVSGLLVPCDETALKAAVKKRRILRKRRDVLCNCRL